MIDYDLFCVSDVNWGTSDSSHTLTIEYLCKNDDGTQQSVQRQPTSSNIQGDQPVDSIIGLSSFPSVPTTSILRCTWNATLWNGYDTTNDWGYFQLNTEECSDSTTIQPPSHVGFVEKPNYSGCDSSISEDRIVLDGNRRVWMKWDQTTQIVCASDEKMRC